MNFFEYWNALTPPQRLAAGISVVLLALITLAVSVWLLRDPYVPLATGVNDERLGEILKQLDAAKVDYRVADDTDAVLVLRSQVGKARAATSGTHNEGPPDVGLELFKETDFSSTDFAQRINYQRALQGELTRTIETIAGVRSARVHVILPDSSFLKRNSARPTAAVSLTLQPRKVLSGAQVRGIQRLVAASVPEIKIDDVVVLDESATSLTRQASGTEGDLSSAQLDLKRQADQYLESKLQRLLQELVPQGLASFSVDTTLDDKQLRITTEEPIAARAATSANHAAGVLIKERQSQRGHAGGFMQTDGSEADADSTDWEYEYKVGNRIEQTLSAPGSIKRISVAVALQGAPGELSSGAVEELVAHAVGIDRARGDSVTVLLLPAAKDTSVGTGVEAAHPTTSPASINPTRPIAQRASSASIPEVKVLALLLIAMSAAIAAFLWRSRRSRNLASAPAQIDEVAAKVRQWLNEGTHNGRV